MDLELENKISKIMSELQLLSPEGLDFNSMDPVVKMMLVALLNEAQKIRDHIDTIDQRIIERYCTDFIPRNKVGAVPALAMLCPTFKQKKDLDAITIGAGTSFVYKTGPSPSLVTRSLC